VNEVNSPVIVIVAARAGDGRESIVAVTSTSEHFLSSFCVVGMAHS
jgi:hypothetical protein